MGCLSRIGCLAVVAVGGVIAWSMYGDRVPTDITRSAQRAGSALSDQVRKGAKSLRTSSRADDARAHPIAWMSLDDAPTGDIEALRQLSRRDGPAFVTLTAPQLASLLITGLERELPRSATHAQIAISGDALLVRAVVDLRDFAGSSAIGALIGSALSTRDTVQLGGTLDVVRPGLAQFRIRDVRLKGIDLPTRLIPTVLQSFKRVTLKDSIADNAIALPLPMAIADVRVMNGRVTLYRAVP